MDNPSGTMDALRVGYGVIAFTNFVLSHLVDIGTELPITTEFSPALVRDQLHKYQAAFALGRYALIPGNDMTMIYVGDISQAPTSSVTAENSGDVQS